MTVIGVTGGTGSGKSTASALWSKRGAAVLDADAVYHRLLRTDERMLAELQRQFPACFGPDGLNRTALAALVFSEPAALDALNRITHGTVLAELDRLLEARRSEGSAAAVIDAIYLFESGLNTRCTVTAAVVCPEDERLGRIVKRDGLTREQARLRAQSQRTEAFYRANADYILENNGDLDAFIRSAEQLYDRIIGGMQHEQQT